MKRLGDAVKSVTEALGIPQCPPCEERQRKLNALDDRIRGAVGKVKRELLREKARIVNTKS